MQDDAAHDLSHFRRVWATATQLAAGEEIDRRASSACWRHDIVNAKNHPGNRSSDVAAEKTLADAAVGLCPVFLRIVTGGQPYHRAHSSAPAIHRTPGRKQFRMPIDSSPLEPLIWRSLPVAGA